MFRATMSESFARIRPTYAIRSLCPARHLCPAKVSKTGGRACTIQMVWPKANKLDAHGFRRRAVRAIEAARGTREVDLDVEEAKLWVLSKSKLPTKKL